MIKKKKNLIVCHRDKRKFKEEIEAIGYWKSLQRIKNSEQVKN